MKFYIPVIVIGLSVVAWSACNKKDINLKPTLPTDATYFNTEQQFDQGVIGIYSKLVFFYNYRGYSGNGWLHDVRLLPDDDLTTNSIDPFEVFSTLTASDGKVNDYFTYLYQLNARANDLLDILSEKGDKVFTNADHKNAVKGEMLFLRGFTHFQLWNLYGVAPVINVRISNDSLLYPSNSTGTQLLDAAITDFEAAALLLPVSWDNANTGRVTKDAAYGMGGKARLFRATVNKDQADYTAAITDFDNIKDHSLVANYYDNFNPATQNNQESLFEVQLGRNSRAEGSNPWLNTDQFDGNGDISGYWGIFDNHWSLFGVSRFFATASMKSAYQSGDPRKDSSIDADGNVLKYVKGTFGGETPFGASYDNDARVLRYADVLLMKAEALVESGGSTSAAIDLINQVRARARNSSKPASLVPADLDNTETDVTTILKWIIEERRVELAFEEGHRWFDLRRWHFGGVLQQVYGKDLTHGWDFSSVQPSLVFQEKNLYLPIPFSELQLNPKLKQNPLWQ